jgi:hypothetical protein
MRRFTYVFILLATLTLTACDETEFESTWQDPKALSIELPRETSAAFLLSKNKAVRRSFEANLARDLTERGIRTIPGYRLLPDSDITDKKEILARLSNTNIDNAVFMRIVDREQEVTYSPGSVWYPGPYYDPFLWYGGVYRGPAFYGYGYYDPGYYRVDTIVSVETLLYSVPDSHLLWAGLSKTMNPSEVDDFVKDLVSETVKEMHKTGILNKEAETKH